MSHTGQIYRNRHIETCHKESFPEQSIAEIAAQLTKLLSARLLFEALSSLSITSFEKQTKQNPNFDFCLAKALCYIFNSPNLLTSPILHFAIAPQSDCEIK